MPLVGKGHVRGIAGTTAAWTGAGGAVVTAALNRIYGVNINESSTIVDLPTSDGEFDGSSSLGGVMTCEITGSIIGVTTEAEALDSHDLPASLATVTIVSANFSELDGAWNYVTGSMGLSYDGVSTFSMTLRRTKTNGADYAAMS